MEEVHYLLGNRCNLNCDFCFWDKRNLDVAWEIKQKIINNIIRSGFKQVTISGGEPSINEDFINVLRQLKKNGVMAVVHTNGINITTTMLNTIKPLIARVSLSLDGSDEDTCIKMRKDPRSYTQVILLLDKILENNIPVNVKTLITKVNASDIINIGKYLKSRDIDYWTLMEFNPINRGKRFEKKFELEDREFDAIIEKVRNTIKDIVIKIKLFKRSPEKYLFVAPNGEVYTYYPGKGDILVGNALKKDLSQIVRCI